MQAVTAQGATLRRSTLTREALAASGGAAILSALVVWFGPPGTDFAAHVYQRAIYLQHGFALWNNFWYAGRYSFVTYSLLYYPLAALLGIRLLAVATIVGRRRLRVRARRPAAVGRSGALVDAAHSRSSGPPSVALRPPSRSASAPRWRCSPSSRSQRAAPVALRAPRRADAGGEPARLPPARARPRRARDRAAHASARIARRRPRSPRSVSSRPLLWRALPDRRPSTRSRSAELLARARLLRLRDRASPGGRARAAAARSSPSTPPAACSPSLSPPRSARTSLRLRYIAAADRRAALSLRDWRPLPVAVVALGARALLEHLAARRQLHAAVRRPVRRTPRTGRRWSGTSTTHLTPSYRVEAVDTDRPLGGGIPAAGRNPARARLVPAGRLPAERGPLRPPRRRAPTSPGCAARRPLRRARRRAARLQRRSGERPAAERAAGCCRSSSRTPTADDLRGPAAAADRDRAGPRRIVTMHGGGVHAPRRTPGTYRIAVRSRPTGTRRPAASPPARTG